MPNLRFVALAAASALALTACSTSPIASPAGSPSALPTEPGTPPPTNAPTPTPVPTPIPLDPQGCTDTAGVDLGSVTAGGDASPGQLEFNLQVTKVEALFGGKGVSTPPPKDVRNMVGLLVGGYEFTTHPSIHSADYLPPVTIEATTATLTLDGGSATDLAVRFVAGNENFNQAAITVPDVEGPATLDLAFTWTERCYRYEASASVRVDVVGRTTTAGCEMEEKAYRGQLEALLDRSLMVGDVAPKVDSPFNHSKYASYSHVAIDALIQYGFDPDASAVRALPGSAIRIVNRQPGLTLDKNMSFWLWTRASVADAVKRYPPEGLIEVLHGTPVQQPDGTFSLLVPDAPGRYAAGVELTYATACTTGTLWLVVNIDVAAPS